MPHAQDMYTSRNRSHENVISLLQDVTDVVQAEYGETHGIIYESGEYKSVFGSKRWVVRIRVPQTLEILDDYRNTVCSGEDLVDRYHQLLHQQISNYHSSTRSLGHLVVVQGIIDTTAKVRIRCNKIKTT